MAKRKVKRGQAIRWTEEEIDSFLNVTPEDVDLLRAAWKKYSIPGLADLIDAQLKDNVLDDITGNTSN